MLTLYCIGLFAFDLRAYRQPLLLLHLAAKGRIILSLSLHALLLLGHMERALSQAHPGACRASRLLPAPRQGDKSNWI